MEMDSRELWTVVHGTAFGGIFLLGFSGALYAVYSMKPEWLSAEGVEKTVKAIKVYLWGLVISSWAAVFTGAWIVYPWYRAKPPTNATDFTHFSRSLLLLNRSTAQWHGFGMEWKEHVGFFAPIAATVAAFAVSYYGPALARKVRERRAVMIFLFLAFAAAAAAGVLGALITKVAPVR